ncbi:MAG: RNA polymerase sigma factor [Bacteriovoracaceae bacterium]|nr:RNA polymerase sigma factor [Bacteriovoracaceae bacterium]
MEMTFGLIGNINKKYSDQQLMEKVSAEDRQAFSVLFDRYKGKVVSYLYYQCKDQSIAEELAQEAFLRVYRFRESYDPQKNFKGWLFTIARNLMMDHFRKKSEVQLGEGVVENTTIDENIDGSEIILIGKADRQILKEALEKLPATQNEALSLWMEELSYEEMAHIMRKSAQAVKNLVHRARKNLIDIISQEER